jgi:hypothetical protein
MRLGYFDQKTYQCVSDVIQNFETTDQRTVTAIGKFNWLWPCFEAKHCNTRANPNTLNTFSEHPDTIHFFTQPSYMQAYVYFRERYRDNADRLNSLASSQDDRNIIAEGMADISEPIQKTKTLCRIVYRLRNNLFHGAKGQQGLVGQNENFLAANTLLRIWIEVPRA